MDLVVYYEDGFAAVDETHVVVDATHESYIGCPLNELLEDCGEYVIAKVVDA